MTTKEILDILNSAPVFAVLTVIAVTLLMNLSKKDLSRSKSKTTKR